jgi:hypothetical protein
MAKQQTQDQKPLVAMFLALVTAALVLQLPRAPCGVEAGVDAYAPSVTVSACGVGVTLSL